MPACPCRSVLTSRWHRLSLSCLSERERERGCHGCQTEPDGVRGLSPTSGLPDTSPRLPEPRSHFRDEDNNTGSRDGHDMTQIKLRNTRILTLRRVLSPVPRAPGQSLPRDQLRQRQAFPSAPPHPPPPRVRGRVATGFRVWRASTERLSGMKIGSFLLARLMAATQRVRFSW